jgi:hypothetical protein
MWNFDTKIRLKSEVFKLSVTYPIDLMKQTEPVSETWRFLLRVWDDGQRPRKISLIYCAKPGHEVA